MWDSRVCELVKELATGRGKMDEVLQGCGELKEARLRVILGRIQNICLQSACLTCVFATFMHFFFSLARVH